MARLSLVKRLLSGTTTFIEVGGGNEELARLTDEIGIVWEIGINRIQLY